MDEWVVLAKTKCVVSWVAVIPGVL